MNKEDNLPPNWSWVKLGEVCEIIMGQSPPSSTYNTEQIGLPFFQGKAEFTELYPEVKKWCSKPKKLAETDDILLSVRAPVGSTNIANQKCCIGRGLASIRYPDCNKFIFYYFWLVENKLDELGTGTTFKAISSKTLNELQIPLPPLPEQKKIVAKIEELFSELDNGIEQLVRTKEQLKVYKQAVLSWAFSGRLVRKDDIFHQRNKEPKDVIFSGKAAEPGVEYNTMQRDDIFQTQDSGQKDVISNNNGLPEGWKWVKVSELCEVVRGGSPRPAGNPKYYDGNIPFLKVRDLTKDNNKYLNTFEYTIKEAGLHKTRLIKPNTLLISNSGATLGVPKICLIEATMNDGIAAFLNLNPKSNSYLYYFWLSKTEELRNINMGAAQPNLNTNILKNYLVPYCSFEEQQIITSEIETRFSVADKLEQTIDENLEKANSLRQSILKRAFEGRLV